MKMNMKDEANAGATEGREDEVMSKHDKAWQRGFIVPIAKEMKARGVAYLVIVMRDDGKATFVLDTEVPENTEGLASPADNAATKP
jgi:hypothetical protein